MPLPGGSQGLSPAEAGPRGASSICESIGCDDPALLATRQMVVMIHDKLTVSGTVPTELAAMPNLDTLMLLDNAISGTISADVLSPPKLVTVTILGNPMSGTLPSQLGNIGRGVAGAMYKTIKLEGNMISGFIPTELGLLGRGLTSLELIDTRISGAIPSELALASNLRILELHQNRLSGAIPTQLSLLEQLETCYLTARAAKDTLFTNKFDCPQVPLPPTCADGLYGNVAFDGFHLRNMWNGGPNVSACPPLPPLAPPAPPMAPLLSVARPTSLDEDLLPAPTSAGVEALAAVLSAAALAFAVAAYLGMFRCKPIRFWRRRHAVANALLNESHLIPGTPNALESDSSQRVGDGPAQELLPLQARAAALKSESASFCRLPGCAGSTPMDATGQGGCTNSGSTRSNSSISSGSPLENCGMDDSGGSSSDSSISKWDDYARVRKLGRGSAGVAYLMRRERDGSVCVCKVVQLAVEATDESEPTTMGPDEVELVSTEVRILASFHHDHVIRCHGWRIVDHHLHIFMEYATGGTLEQAIRAQARLALPFTAARATTWLAQMGEALEHVHARRVLHRDLKSGNVFLTHEGDVKLGDFGVARAFSTQSNLARTTVGTPYYMAPEVINSEPYGPPSDMWSLGVILHEILTFHRPFPADNIGALVMRITHGSVDETRLRESKFSPALCALASSKGLLHPEPFERPDAAALSTRLLDVMWGDERFEDDEGVEWGRPRRARVIDGCSMGEPPPSTSSHSVPSGEASGGRGNDPRDDEADAVSYRASTLDAFDGASTWTREALSDALRHVSQIDQSELTMMQFLGSGAFGMVHLATRQAADSDSPPMHVAVKTLKSCPREEHVLKRFCEEVNLVNQVRHPNVVAICGLCMGSNAGAEAELSLVMEYMEGGSVWELLRGARQANAPRPVVGVPMLRLLRDAALGMAHVHSCGVLHRDLKSPNLLLNRQRTALKICDFGLSRHSFETNAMTRMGSVLWASPEILRGLAYNALTDVWSFGVVLWEMATGWEPYHGISLHDVIYKVVLGDLRLPPPPIHPTDCPIELLKLMAVCFAKCEKRPHFHQIIYTLDTCIERAVARAVLASRNATEAVTQPLAQMPNSSEKDPDAD